MVRTDRGFTADVEFERALALLGLSCALCRSGTDFRHIVRGQVRELLPHGGLIAMHGTMRDEDSVDFQFLHCVDVPAELRGRIAAKAPQHECSIVARWLQKERPFFVELPSDTGWLSADEREEIQTFELGRLLVHGVCDWGERTGSCFIFTRIGTELASRDLQRSAMHVASLLHVALVRVKAASTPKRFPHPRMALNPAEHELLDWLMAGLDTNEVARRRGIRPETASEQVTQLEGKLGILARGMRPSKE